MFAVRLICCLSVAEVRGCCAAGSFKKGCSTHLSIQGLARTLPSAHGLAPAPHSPMAFSLLSGPPLCRWLQTSFDLLQMASTMREQGYLPPSVSLWAVENPMQAPISRLQRKVEAGAEVILTQPPLVWGRAERWVQEADVARLTEQVKVRRGSAAPCLSFMMLSLIAYWRLGTCPGAYTWSSLVKGYRCWGSGRDVMVLGLWGAWPAAAV